MKLTCFKFNPNTQYETPSIESVEHDLSDPSHMFLTEQFWTKGYCDMGGYRFRSEDCVLILINDEYAPEMWYTRYVPAKSFIGAYLKNFSSGSKYIVLTEDIVEYAD